MSTFSDDLHRFAISVDIVSESTYLNIKEMIGEYFCKQLNFNFVEILKTEFDRSRRFEVLQTNWTKNSSEGILTNSIFDAHGKYSTQTASVFDRRKECWIVSKNKGLLTNSSEYSDLWNGYSDFPKYESANDFSIKTSVILPIPRKDRIWGILNLESEEYLGLDVFRVISKEIKTIVTAFSILTDLHEATHTQNINTKQMVRKLGESLVAEKPRYYGKPKIFIASSVKADKTVIAAIRTVLDNKKYRDFIVPAFWQDIHNPGDIRQQTMKTLEKCKFGICYFSELYNDTYLDNPNVMFEAGILHGKREIVSNSPDNWIPIRETNSPNIPFDIAGERILTIKRLSNNKLNKEEFEDNLMKKIDSMLGL